MQELAAANGFDSDADAPPRLIAAVIAALAGLHERLCDEAGLAHPVAPPFSSETITEFHLFHGAFYRCLTLP